MQRWPDIFAWCSFLSVNYLERPTYFLDQGDDFKEELQLTITMLLWLLTLPASGVVSIVTTTPGCISLIARLYLLTARMSLTTEESLLFAGRALQNLLQLPQSAWDPEFTNELDKTHPSVVNDILYRVIKDTERRPMNCPVLKGGFIILSNICRAPAVLNRMLIRKDAVYWICRAIHKLVVNPAMAEKENIKMATGTIKMGCHYLLEAISQQGYECVVQVVNFRLLSSMLRSTAMVEDDLATENPNPPHPLFTIYGRLLKGIASHTMYRSVLSALERALDRIETQLLDHLVVSSPFSDSWFSFVNVIEDRIEIKVQWDSKFINICSYFDCPESDDLSDPELRWSVCSGCRIAHYCGRRCQMADWERHRVVCASLAKQRSKHSSFHFHVEMP
ncbi:hypothetical protein F5879DRAFT_575977 [Lentinula edodes]|nr:hypothetical protein F5879DRAFT_575977 [Lentinula edodes]